MLLQRFGQMIRCEQPFQSFALQADFSFKVTTRFNVVNELVFLVGELAYCNSEQYFEMKRNVDWPRRKTVHSTSALKDRNKK